MADILKNIVENEALSLYEILADDFAQKGTSSEGHLKRFIASTPQTRAISNDPTVAGTNYTRRLQLACTNVFRNYDFGIKELSTVVLNILRGALNFGLRDALADAYGWSRHNSSFISAQR